MDNKIKTSLVLAAAVLVGAGASFLLLSSMGQNPVAGTDGESAVSVIRTSRKNNVRKVTKISLVENGGKKAVRIEESEIARPGSQGSVTTEEIDEADLTPEQKRILAELQDALDRENLKQVRKVLSKFWAKVENGGLGGKVPVCMRSRAVEALGWFGKDAAIDLMQFVADPSEEVSSEAFNQFEMALGDSDMGDLERSTIVKAAMQALNDEEQIDSLLSQLNDMRNSRKVATIEDILKNGTDQAKKIMREQMPDYTDSEVATDSDLKKWQAENPDEEGDAELYGK